MVAPAARERSTASMYIGGVKLCGSRLKGHGRCSPSPWGSSAAFVASIVYRSSCLQLALSSCRWCWPYLARRSPVLLCAGGVELVVRRRDFFLCPQRSSAHGTVLILRLPFISWRQHPRPNTQYLNKYDNILIGRAVSKTSWRSVTLRIV